MQVVRLASRAAGSHHVHLGAAVSATTFPCPCRRCTHLVSPSSRKNNPQPEDESSTCDGVRSNTPSPTAAGEGARRRNLGGSTSTPTVLDNGSCSRRQVDEEADVGWAAAAGAAAGQRDDAVANGVLVVDDTSSVRNLMMRAVRRMGHDVEAASTGQVRGTRGNRRPGICSLRVRAVDRAGW